MHNVEYGDFMQQEVELIQNKPAAPCSGVAFLIELEKFLNKTMAL